MGNRHQDEIETKNGTPNRQVPDIGTFRDFGLI
jgi:hypothetical protein